LVHELPLGADEPSRLVPYSPPVHVGIVQVPTDTSCCLLTLLSRVAVLADAGTVITIALPTTSTVKGASPELTRRPDVR